MILTVIYIVKNPNIEKRIYLDFLNTHWKLLLEFEINYMYPLLFFLDRVWSWSMNVLLLIVCSVYNYKARLVILELHSAISTSLNSTWSVLSLGYYVAILFFLKSLLLLCRYFVIYFHFCYNLCNVWLICILHSSRYLLFYCNNKY